jgi:hypothetical protein
MQTVLNHMDAVVRPALRKYVEAENGLTSTRQSKEARQNVMLAARQAVYELHHLSDFVMKEPSPPLAFAKIEDVRTAVEAQCVSLRSRQPVADVALLRDVADAFKHHRPDRKNAMVAASSDVVPVSIGFGKADYGEGKFDGEQVIITTKKKNGDQRARALSSVLQNVFDAWMTVLGQKLPPIGQY